MTGTKQTGFSIKDKFTIILSLAALAISATSFYFSNVRVEDNLQARVTNTDIIRSISDTTKCDTAVVGVAFVNGGNRQAIILSPLYQTADTTANFSNSKSFPIILQPHEMKIVELKLSAQSLTLKPGKTSLENPSQHEYHLSIEFFSLDSEAKNHDVWGEFDVRIYMKGKEIWSISEVDYHTDYASTDLFSDKKERNSIVILNKSK